jgi:hypothetical protein
MHLAEAAAFPGKAMRAQARMLYRIYRGLTALC